MKQNLLFNQASAIGKRIAMVLTMLLTVGIGQAWGAGTETFENAASSTSYGSVSWEGVNGLQWSASSFRTDQKISGNRGLTSKASTACTITMPLTSVQQSEGMGVFTFKYKYPYSDSSKKNNLSFTINGSTYTGTVSYNSNAQTVNITVNQSNLPATITINIASGGRACFDDFSWTSYVSADPYTVTLKDDNSTLTQSSAGESVTLPPRNGCDGYTFVGWTKSWSVAQTTWTTTAPTIIPTGSYTPTANESLYPVYTKTEGSGSEPTAYSAGDVGSFIIASNVGNKWYAIPENPTLSSGKITGVEITVSQTAGGVKYVSTANAEGYTWTIADATNGQTISDGSKYIYHSNGGSSGTNLAYGTSTSYTWKIEKEDTGLTFKGMSGSTTNSRGLLFNGSVFGGYALSNEDASGYYRIQVLPIAGGSTTYYISIPDCITEPTVCLIHKNRYFYSLFF